MNMLVKQETRTLLTCELHKAISMLLPITLCLTSVTIVGPTGRQPLFILSVIAKLVSGPVAIMCPNILPCLVRLILFKGSGNALTIFWVCFPLVLLGWELCPN